MRKLNICSWKLCKAIKSNLGLSIAFSLSAVWSFGALLILLVNFRYAEGEKTLDLNEIGDYLAGSFSPLAFGWLVYGYLMQNRELKNQLNQFKKNLNFQIESKESKENEINKKSQPLIEIEEKKNNSNGTSFIISCLQEELNDTFREQQWSSSIIENLSSIEDLRAPEKKVEKMIDDFFSKEKHLSIELTMTAHKNSLYNLSITNSRSSDLNISNQTITKFSLLHHEKEESSFSFTLFLTKKSTQNFIKTQEINIPFKFEDENRNIQRNVIKITCNIFNSSVIVDNSVS
ncbi:hypothetical protein [Marinomonas fungiae]|uniref:hypothetical protein n=1 Tax=Marinomonas fungiae TaxID=1137284 RepID=UPI003A901E37